MRVPDVVCDDIRAQVMVLSDLSELKAGLPHQGGGVPADKKECILTPTEVPNTAKIISDHNIKI